MQKSPLNHHTMQMYNYFWKDVNRILFFPCFVPRLAQQAQMQLQQQQHMQQQDHLFCQNMQTGFQPNFGFQQGFQQGFNQNQQGGLLPQSQQFQMQQQGQFLPQPPLQPMQFGQTPMQAQQMMFPPQPPMSFGAPQAFPQGQFSPQVNPLLQQNQQQGFMQQPQRPQFQKNIGGVVVLSVIALLHFVHPACIHV